MKRRNKALTVLFSFCPGAGQMFQGFMICGLELLIAFFGTIMLDVVTNIDALLLLLPIIWIYSFFDSINKMAYDDERFAATEDKLIFNLKGYHPTKAFYRICGVVLIVIGFVSIWNMLATTVFEWMNSMLFEAEELIFLSEIIYVIPKVIFALLIIAGGIILICHKKKEIENGADQSDTDK